MRIETERLILRPFEEQDASALEPLLGDPEVMAFSDAGPLGAEARADWLQRARENPGMLAILTRAQMRLVGYIGLTVSPDRIRPGEIELGFRLMRAVWGQ
ncbi:MAG: GNAT family N-acetyltransferase, partial [Pseudomonadota bacterium]